MVVERHTLTFAALVVCSNLVVGLLGWWSSSHTGESATEPLADSEARTRLALQEISQWRGGTPSAPPRA